MSLVKLRWQCMQDIPASSIIYRARKHRYTLIRYAMSDNGVQAGVISQGHTHSQGFPSAKWRGHAELIVLAVHMGAKSKGKEITMLLITPDWRPDAYTASKFEFLATSIDSNSSPTPVPKPKLVVSYPVSISCLTVSILALNVWLFNFEWTQHNIEQHRAMYYLRQRTQKDIRYYTTHEQAPPEWQVCRVSK